VIPYDLKKIRAIIFDVDGVLSRQTIAMDENGEPLRTVNIRDGYAIQLAVKEDMTIALMTGGNNEAIRKRYERLGVKEIHMKCDVKITTYENFLQRHSLTDEEVMYMGDDIPDHQIMSRCGCPVCPKDACPEIKALSIYVSDYCGGEGCARDVIEQTLKAQGKWMKDEHAFGW